MWVDTSIKFIGGNLSLYYETALRTGGIITFLHTGHSIFAVTPPQMFQHLPCAEDPRTTECLVATVFVAYRTSFVIQNIIKWWVACALSQHCIESDYGRRCSFQKDSYRNFAYCSRYDQSALSIIIANLFGSVNSTIGPSIAGDKPYNGIVRIERSSMADANPKTC